VARLIGFKTPSAESFIVRDWACLTRLTWAFPWQARHVFFMKARPARGRDRSARGTR